MDSGSKQHQGKPVLYYKPLTGAEAKPAGEGYSVFFTPMPGHQPLYTHADPAEVERWKSSAEHFAGISAKAAEEVSKLRAQLAERDALLREAITVCRTNDLHITASYFESKLSASVKPSAF